MKAYVLLDRDGVLNVDLPGSLCALADLRMIPGSAQAVHLLGEKGYGVLVVTNQACVGRGDLSAGHLEEIHRAMETRIEEAGGRIEDWFVCAHRAEDACGCRKPRPGLIRDACQKYGFDPARTFFVGDAGRDVEAARAAGCIPVLVRTGKGERSAVEHPGIEIHDDLLAFATALAPTEGMS